MEKDHKLWSIYLFHTETLVQDCALKSISKSSFSQIPQCIRLLSHNAPLCNRNVHICAHFCYNVVHCGIVVWCIVGFVTVTMWWIMGYGTGALWDFYNRFMESPPWYQGPRDAIFLPTNISSSTSPPQSLSAFAPCSRPINLARQQTWPSAHLHFFMELEYTKPRQLGLFFIKKDGLCRYGKFHYEDKMVMRLSCIYDGNS